MPAASIDKTLVRRRFSRSRASYDEQAPVQREMAERLCALLAGVPGAGANLGRVLELGCGTGVLTRAMLARFRMTAWTGNDIVPDCAMLADEVRAAGVADTGFVHADMEGCDFPSGWDVIAANAALQWMDDPVAFAASLDRFLAPGGLLTFSLFGPDNLREIGTLTGLGLRYPSRAEVLTSLARTGSVLAVEEYRRAIAFDSPRDVLRHLKATGTNALVRSRWSRRDLESFTARYRHLCGDTDGRVSLTYHPMLFVVRFGRRPDRAPSGEGRRP